MAWLAAAAPLLLLQVCSANPDAKIIGGEMATEGQFPYQASLQWGSDHVCGATVYDERNVITAAHCCDGKPDKIVLFSILLIKRFLPPPAAEEDADKFRIQVGLVRLSDDDDDDVQTVDVQWMKIHPGYDDSEDNESDFTDDICVVHLEDELDMDSSVDSVPLARTGHGEDCVIAGWGVTSVRKKSSFFLELEYLEKTISFSSLLADGGGRCPLRRPNVRGDGRPGRHLLQAAVRVAVSEDHHALRGIQERLLPVICTRWYFFFGPLF